MTATQNNPLSPSTSASDTEQRYHAGGAFAMKEQGMAEASNVQQASGEAVVLDTTGTGIPTVETHDGDSPNWQTMCRTAMAQADAYRDLVEDWKRLYHATKSQRDALAEACRMVVRRWDDARLDDSDMDALRAALSTGGGK